MNTQPPHQDETIRQLRAIKTILLWLLVLAAGVIFYVARDLFLPIFLGFLIALTFRPVIRLAERRGLSPAVAAGGMALGLAFMGAAAGYFGARPVSNALAEVPMMVDQLRHKMQAVNGSVEQMQKVSDQVEELTGGESNVPKVTTDDVNILRSAASGALSTSITLAMALVLATLLLGSGNLFHEKLVQSFAVFSDKKAALKAAHEVERRISRYLLTITLINAGLGLAVGGSFWLFGMPNAALFAALAFVLNFLPYVGALIGVAISAGFALLEFSAIDRALAVPLAYLVLTSIEGQFVTPVFLGRQLRLNAVAVFTAVVLWAWLWGVSGALMAVPFLVLVKVVADAVPGLEVLSNFLSARSRGRLPAAVRPPET